VTEPTERPTRTRHGNPASTQDTVPAPSDETPDREQADETPTGATPFGDEAAATTEPAPDDADDETPQITVLEASVVAGTTDDGDPVDAVEVVAVTADGTVIDVLEVIGVEEDGTVVDVVDVVEVTDNGESVDVTERVDVAVDG
jgi:hypothetical protein